MLLYSETAATAQFLETLLPQGPAVSWSELRDAPEACLLWLLMCCQHKVQLLQAAQLLDADSGAYGQTAMQAGQQ